MFFVASDPKRRRTRQRGCSCGALEQRFDRSRGEFSTSVSFRILGVLASNLRALTIGSLRLPQAHHQRTPSLNTIHYFSLFRFLGVLASNLRALTIGRQRQPQAHHQRTPSFNTIHHVSLFRFLGVLASNLEH